MLVRCNLNCKNGVTTDASLNLDTDEVICNKCGDVIENITSYAKNAMKSNGDIIRVAKGKAFTFKCTYCAEDIQVFGDDNDRIVGKGCNNIEKCNFDITDYMKRTVSLYSKDEEGQE